MRKIIVAEFVSFDGVMQAPGSAEEDTEGGTPWSPTVYASPIHNKSTLMCLRG